MPLLKHCRVVQAHEVRACDKARLHILHYDKDMSETETSKPPSRTRCVLNELSSRGFYTPK